MLIFRLATLFMQCQGAAIFRGATSIRTHNNEWLTVEGVWFSSVD